MDIEGLFKAAAFASSAVGFACGALGIRYELLGARQLDMGHVLVSGITALNLGLFAYLIVRQ